MSSVETIGRVVSPLQRVNTKGFSQEAEWIHDELTESRIHFTGTLTTRTQEQRFFALKKKWKEETLFSSSSTEMLTNPSYLEIISMGKDALPFILNDIQVEQGHWFMALKIITGNDPVPITEKGKVDLMTKRWIAWGKDNGYVS